ncbi:hypothetical protein [Actinoplanes sp. NPDC051494]|uniref:hypothetical protein n=1 Tax=Actinoplanes sp. NPDC051494 TaxID=3363907 RepID=UPI00378A5C1E
MADVTKVDLPGVTKVGTAVDDAAKVLDTAYTDYTPKLAGASALTGWATGPQLTSGAQTWTTYLADLRGDVRGYGEDLVQSAKDYQATDEAAAAAVQQPMYGPWVPR